jgi:hypothetical protein
MASTSGQSNYFLSNSDVVLEAFDNCEIRPPAITSEHMISARRSLNLEFSSWDSSVPLLWKVDATPTLIPLQQGVSVYNLPTDTVTMLDTYIRTFQLPNQFNVTPSFTTTANSNIVTANIANTGMLPGYWFQITTPVAIDGILLFGFYEVITVLSNSFFTFAATSNAIAGATGGLLPFFATISTSTLVSVTFSNHGLVAGQSFNVAASTVVGGITILGSYIVQTVISANLFTIQTNMVASINASAYENNGMVQLQTQSNTVDPIDRILTPIGRTDYAEFPDKFTQTIPTQYYFARNVNPTVTLYQVPDGNGPYVLSVYLMRRIQNAGLGMGEIPDIHFLALDAICKRMSARLAIKYAKAMLPVLAPIAKEAWDNFLEENRERAEICLAPNLAPYYRI